VATAVLLAAGATVGCGDDESPGRDDARTTTPGGGGWQRLADPPLSPRTRAMGVWTGDEMVVVGGESSATCPPNASCEAPPADAYLRDGAAYDPVAGTWRPVVDAPVPLAGATATAFGGEIVVWVPTGSAGPALLAHAPGNDAWTALTPPPVSDPGWYRVTGAGERLVAVHASDEAGEQPDLVYDADADTWAALPDDPLTPGFERSIVGAGRRLVLLDHELVPNPGSERPSLTRAAVLDLESMTWTALPPSEILGVGPALVEGDRVVIPSLGSADGGAVNGWGRSFPFGGILDLAAGTWGPVPEPAGGPPSPDQPDRSAGAVGSETATYTGGPGLVLDVAAGRWREIPEDGGPPFDPAAPISGRTVVAAGRDLVLYGGERWSDGPEGEVLADAWLWSPD
jgi:hypothetical protein